MTCILMKWIYAGAKPVHRNHLVRVVVLEDVTDRFERLKVFVLAQVTEIMQRAFLMWLFIRSREIDGNIQVDLAAAKHVVKEVDGWLCAELDNLDFSLTGLEGRFLLDLTQ